MDNKNNIKVIDKYIVEDVNTDPDKAILSSFQYIYQETRKNYQGIHSSYIEKDLKNIVIENLFIPEGVTFIEAGAFQGLNIKKVSFPSTLIEISPNAFLDCKMLNDIEFRHAFKKASNNTYNVKFSELKSIGNNAFKNTALVKVVLPESVRYTAHDIFADCHDLEECNIPTGVSYLFPMFNNTKISAINFSTNVGNIGNDFFKNTLIKNTTILDNIKNLGYGCFSNSNLEVININGLDKNIGKQDKMPNLKVVNFSFKNKKNEIINYGHSKEKNKQIISFVANEDGYLFVNKSVGYNLDAFLKKEEYIFYTKYGKNIVSLDKMKNYFHVDKNKLNNTLNQYQYEIGLPSLYKWILAVEKRNKGNHKAFLPSANIVKHLKDDEKLRIRYFVIEDEYKKLYAMFNKNNKVEIKEFINFCYIVGLFSDNKEEHDSAYAFLEKISTIDIQNYVRNFINIDNYTMIDIKYNKNFANFFKQNFMDVNSFKENDIDFTRRIYLSFDNIYNSIKNNKKEMNKESVFRYLTENKYIFNAGNEVLATLASNYAEKYDQNDFDNLQTIFELGKKVTKKIIQTKDSEVEGVTYLWSPGSNPINLFLGHEDKASCCAKLHGVGESIMINSVVNPNIQNLILFDEHKNIIGKSTAYYNEDENYILFNNVEVNKNYLGIANEKKILLALKRAINDQVKALEKVRPLQKVSVGMKFNDIHEAIKAEHKVIKKPEEFLKNFEYERYNGDANDTAYGQAMLYKRK